ncbi:MAG: hypothetical protein NTZ35_01290 [Ignavibacteriales bacterium]|nr:hypothetical protein [Ignavibacteriales bacterium]
MKSLLLMVLFPLTTFCQTNFNSGFDESSFGDSFKKTVTIVTEKNFTDMKVEREDAWKNVFGHSYVTLDCTIQDSSAKSFLTFQFFDDSLFVIDVREYPERTLNQRFAFLSETKRTFLGGSGQDKYPKDAEGFHDLEKVRIKYDGLHYRYELRYKSIDTQFQEVKKKVEQLQKNRPLQGI